ncbi:MAG TPA: 50S ribosomal protein L40e [Candidatus Nanoarchaeia archaeon]|nr:50S ribosomal protein L40e [Candidatus Nanoarchaeia archaeon]
MVKFPEADKRLFRNKFVCRGCKATVKGPMLDVLAGRVKCRACKRTHLRPKRKK